MRFRDYLSSMFFCYKMWPPPWVGEPRKLPFLQGEVGRLVEVRYNIANPRRTFLVIEHEEKRFIGCLLFRDYASCERTTKFLQACCGMRIKDIGDLEIRFSPHSPVPIKPVLNRPAFWIIPKLMRS